MAGLDRRASRRTHSVLIAKRWSNDFVCQRNHILVKLDSKVLRESETYKYNNLTHQLTKSCLKMFGGSTGGPSSTCELIILRNESHSKIIRVCMGIFTTALRNKKKYSQIFSHAI